MKWENKIVKIDAVSAEEAQNKLNDGLENWELVGVVTLHMGFWAFLKRPKRKKKTRNRIGFCAHSDGNKNSGLSPA